MKNIKILFLLAISIMLNSCVVEDDQNPYYPPGEFGIYPNFTAGANSVYNLLDPVNSIVDFTVEASESGGAVVKNGEILAAINSGTFSKVADMTSFPYNVSLSLTDVVNALGITTASLTGGDLVKFRTSFTDSSGTITTSTGTFEAAVICPPIAGTYTIYMQDSFGDGWQGGGINAILDGDVTFINIPDGGGSSLVSTYIVPEGATALVWEWNGLDAWNAEVSFQIYDPNDQLINDSADPPAGILSVPSTCP